ncbi:MAG: hypothetical protein H5T73_09340 [Actinobacteria bacterium]|nr:hypothetical protein [Actinomycetota bacterium]
MKVEELLFGILSLAWGVILLAMRAELLGFAREGGRGLRDRRVLNVLVVSAACLLFVGGTYLLVARAL